MVEGHVTRAGGEPVALAVVRISALDETCDGSERWIFDADTGNDGPAVELTDADGAFGTRLRSPLAPGLACLRLEVTPPAGSGFAATVVEGATVYFDDDYPRESREVVTVDVELGPAGAGMLQDSEEE